jgi:glycosyltransferase involved in cell wall biosynthesis
MKILYIIPSPLSFKIFLTSLAQNLLLDNVSVYVLCNKYEKLCYIEGVNYNFIELPRNVSLIKTIKASRKIQQLIIQIKPDIIHVHFSSAAVLTYLSFKNYFPPIIITIQGLAFPMQKCFLKSLIFRFLEIRALRIAKISYVLTEDDFLLVKKYVPKLRLQLSPGFGCDLRKFGLLNHSDKCALKESLNIKTTDIVIIYIGRLVSFKGFHIALRAYLKARLLFPQLKFIVCGEFDKIHSSLLTSKELYILFNDNRIIMTGFIENIEDYLAVSDINIFPSSREGMPVNLMESISMGVPVITRDVRGCKHVVKHGKTGILIPSSDYIDFTNSILELINNPEMLAIFKSNCLNERSNFDRTR